MFPFRKPKTYRNRVKVQNLDLGQENKNILWVEKKRFFFDMKNYVNKKLKKIN